MIHKHRFFSLLKHAKATLLYANHVAQLSPQVSYEACNAPKVFLLVVPHQNDVHYTGAVRQLGSVFQRR